MIGPIQSGYLRPGSPYLRPYTSGAPGAPVPPVSPVPSPDPVAQRRPTTVVAPPQSALPDIRQGADPVEMAVRSRIRYLSPEQVDELARGGTLDGPNEAGQTRSAQDIMDQAQCETCENRKYQDGSDDPGVSFQTPAHIDPDQAASVVRGHEQEHVVREQAKAQREDRKVVSQSVTLHNSICPECGRTYVSGGTTRTTTRADQSAALQDQLTQKAKQAFGMNPAA